MDSGTLYDITNLIEMCRNEPDIDRLLKSFTFPLF